MGAIGSEEEHRSERREMVLKAEKGRKRQSRARIKSHAVRGWLSSRKPILAQIGTHNGPLVRRSAEGRHTESTVSRFRVCTSWSSSARTIGSCQGGIARSYRRVIAVTIPVIAGCILAQKLAQTGEILSRSSGFRAIAGCRRASLTTPTARSVVPELNAAGQGCGDRIWF